jgi:hypothetical protein
MQSLDRPAEGDFGRIKQPVHVVGQSSRHIPIVRLRTDMSTALQPHPAIADSIGRAYAKKLQRAGEAKW